MSVRMFAAMTQFFVYENWRAHGQRATVHRGECSYCNDGRGARGGTRPDNGRWHGPFDNFNAADNTALRCGGERRLCGSCRPSA
jgi:hypothetical protein